MKQRFRKAWRVLRGRDEAPSYAEVVKDRSHHVVNMDKFDDLTRFADPSPLAQPGVSWTPGHWPYPSSPIELPR